ncbi:MAG TPA: PqqD family protein [Vicinamibacteria bacterium]|nr:PqqD family protein [Vicinamibacteria bacterium]
MNVLDLTPHRAADWTERDGLVVLVRPRPAARSLRGLIDGLGYLLAAKRLRLDALGSFCWRQIDGKRTPWEIATVVRREFGSECEPAEERVGRFLRMLAREGLVYFDELATRM